MSRKSQLALLFCLSFLIVTPALHVRAAAPIASTEEPSNISQDFSTEAGANLPKPETITYTSNGLNLVGYLYKPSGTGPFPAYMWNHGSDKNPSEGRKLAKFWNDHGFVFFAPIRSGHGSNPGAY